MTEPHWEGTDHHYCDCEKPRNMVRAGMLGTLAHRAVLMPFAKPQALFEGKLILPAESIQEAVAASAQYLVGALRPQHVELSRKLNSILQDATEHPTRHMVDYVLDPEDDWSPLSIIIDSGGPWWNLSASQFLGQSPMQYVERPPEPFFEKPKTHHVFLTDDDRWKIRRRTKLVAMSAARVLEEKAIEEGWKSLWSEVPVPAWGLNDVDLKRADIVVGFGKNAARSLVIDLKFRARSPAVTDEDREQLKELRKRLAGMNFPSAHRTEFAVICVHSRNPDDAVYFDVASADM